MGTSAGRRGNGGGAHSDLNGGLSGLGEGSEQAGRRGGSPAADSMDEDDGVASGVPRARASSWGCVVSRRSLWTGRRGEEEAMAAVVFVGGGDSARWLRAREPEEERSSGRE